MKQDFLSQAPLGQSTGYASTYDASLLCAIPRALQRDDLDLNGRVMHGADVWRAYEVSWLNVSGLPQVGVGQCVVPSDSPMLIESKSMKLYINAFNQSHFDSRDDVAAAIAKDFSGCAQAEVTWRWLSADELACGALEGVCLDALSLAVDVYDVCADHLKVDDSTVAEEQLYSHLFKSNCLVTGQPDWASVHVAYRGHAMDHTGLLKYLVSYRSYQSFHEHCVERIWLDVMQRCQPEYLTVRAYFTRRGGIDINPVRSSLPVPLDHCLRLPRQ